jgi:DNA-binding GntR family transcriptional regulator
MHGRIVAALRDKSAAEARRLMKESLRGWKEDMMAMHFKGHFEGHSDGKREHH